MQTDRLHIEDKGSKVTVKYREAISDSIAITREVRSVPDQQIRVALKQMDIFVALITPFFDASSYIHEVEVPIFWTLRSE